MSQKNDQVINIFKVILENLEQLRFREIHQLYCRFIYIALRDSLNTSSHTLSLAEERIYGEILRTMSKFFKSITLEIQEKLLSGLGPHLLQINNFAVFTEEEKIVKEIINMTRNQARDTDFQKASFRMTNAILIIMREKNNNNNNNSANKKWHQQL